MLDGGRDLNDMHGDYVEFLEAGTHATGEFHCAGCGYGVTIHSELPRCPMCGGGEWEAVSWSPLSRALQLQ
jgi:rubrerythrin